jgi:TolA-binding protein
MIRFANTIPVCCLLAASALAPAQTPPPPPPAPAPVAVPAPPAPPSAPTPMAMPAPRAVYLEDLGVPIDIQQKIDEAMAKVDMNTIGEEAARAAEKAMEVQQKLNIDMQDRLQDMKLNLNINAADMELQAQDMALRAAGKWDMAFAQQTSVAPKAPTPPMPPVQVFGPGQFRFMSKGSTDGLYDRGQRSLDSRNYDQALEAFTEVVNRGGNRADAALYWKAYTLNKLGRRDEASAALAELHSKYASSRWMDDAKALEIEVKQSSGQKVTPESQSDDELKLLALNGLMQSDPDRAIPILERLLKGAQSPRVKRDAIYVLAANSNPKAQQLLEQIARGSSGNPDLQLQAIQYLGRTSKQPNRAPLLMEIYNSSNDQTVKRAILNSFNTTNDKDRLMQLAKNEKNADLRMDIIRRIASSGDQTDVWQFYQTETDPALKQELLRMMNGRSDHLIEVARNEKDPKLRRIAVQSLASVHSQPATDALVAMYGSETDPQVKRTIVSALYGQRNVTALVQLGRKETDPDMKREIVRELVNMKSPEATQFLEDILK